MKLPPLTDGKIIRRYKRFLADVELASGEVVTAHCPNTGSMKGCWAPGAPVQLSASDNPKRKLQWTLERIDMGVGWVGVNTGRANHIICDFITNSRIRKLDGYQQIKREPGYLAPGFPKSRFDLLLTREGVADCYVEIKNTTLLEGDCIQFPDSVTERGRKHLDLLQHAVESGHRGVLIFAVNRPEGSHFRAATEIDPGYSDTLKRVAQNGVEIIAQRILHTRTGVRAGPTIPLRLN